ncbi:kinase-like protein, partial [Lophiostoma macrostomum CBS 122681]
YFAVQIHDVFKNGRYKVLNKLGFGGFSTIWAAQDNLDDKIVSLKVIRAKESSSNRELAILQRIQESTLQHPGRDHVVQLLDHFYEEQFGRKNLFIVLEFLGPSVYSVLQERLDLPFSQQLSRQLLLAVDYLQSLGIAHGGK